MISPCHNTKHTASESSSVKILMHAILNLVFRSVQIISRTIFSLVRLLRFNPMNEIFT